MRILVAEDHPQLARSLADGLCEEGYAVDLCFDGNEADRLARTVDYDCAVLDIMLPGKDGWAILRDMRRRSSRVPVLFLTARDSTEDRVKGLDLGADDYLVKPFEWDELMARIRALIRRAHGHGSSTITIADLEIDLGAGRIHRAGQPITLTAREFALLRYLASRQGQVVTRSDILDHLYDSLDETSSNVVDVYIGYLRAKIDKPFPLKLIHTLRGQGYMLSAGESRSDEP